MPLKSYAVLKCRPLEGLEGSDQNPHFQIHGLDQNNVHYRIAVNIRSKTKPADLLYYCDENFRHPITEKIITLGSGFTQIASKPNDTALDFIRGNLFNPRKMRALPADLPGADNDLNEKIAKYVGWAVKTEDAKVYAFGEAWGPEELADEYFNFIPGQGIHNVHMNQGNSGEWSHENGPWQDGGLFFHFPALNQWVALFLTFQSQSFQTDDLAGQPVLGQDIPSEMENAVRIIAAVISTEKNKETVTLVNTANHRIDITGWTIVDSQKEKRILYGEIRPGEFLTIPVSGKANRLSGGGGTITLLDRNGLKVDGVSYTEKDCQKKDFTILFD